MANKGTKEYTERLFKFNEIEAINSENIAIIDGVRLQRFANAIMVEQGRGVSAKQLISTAS